MVARKFTKYFIGDTTLYQYCKENNIDYKKMILNINTYNISPEEALVFHKNKGYTKALREKGITKDNPDFKKYYLRISKGWTIDETINTPFYKRGGNWRLKTRNPSN